MLTLTRRRYQVSVYITLQYKSVHYWVGINPLLSLNLRVCVARFIMIIDHMVIIP